MRLQFLYSIYWCAHSKVENMCRSKGGFYYPKLPLGYEYPTGRAVARGVRPARTQPPPAGHRLLHELPNQAVGAYSTKVSGPTGAARYLPVWSPSIADGLVEPVKKLAHRVS
jgi:hypothetical protein